MHMYCQTERFNAYVAFFTTLKELPIKVFGMAYVIQVEFGSLFYSRGLQARLALIYFFSLASLLT